VTLFRVAFPRCFASAYITASAPSPGLCNGGVLCKVAAIVSRCSLPLAFLLLLAPCAAAAQEAPDLSVLDRVLQQAVEGGEVPGVVALVGHKGQVVYRKAFGWRQVEPEREAMTADTIFDAASLTKPIVTATALMLLMEEGRVRLNDAAARYLPEFAENGKGEITVRHLLTHFSGLPAGLDLKEPWQGKEEGMSRAFAIAPVAPPGAQFLYSDVNYIVLGALVERLSGQPLERFAAERIFRPLGMRDTMFLPPAELRARIAPTEYDGDAMLRGVVHDPTTRRMGGVAGQAGMFTTAHDLARYAQALLDGKHVLTPLGIAKMTTPQSPPHSAVLRGLGWDIDSPFASNRGELLPVGSFGHTGFTGTSLWIDRVTETYIILLANAVHPRGLPAGPRFGSPAVSLRARFANAVAAALNAKLDPEQVARLGRLTGYGEAGAGVRRPVARNAQVMTGIDVLAAESFRRLRKEKGKRRIGLVTNHTGRDAQGRRTLDLVAAAEGVELAAIFSPEHGPEGVLDTADIGHSRDAATGVPVYSVYGSREEQRRPPLEVLRRLDAVLFDVQDVGARYYTYPATLRYFLEAAAQAGIELVVLDRPNPITGVFVQGPLSDEGSESFVNFHPVPIRHGMTVGELARMFAAERNINARLTVVEMQGWQRGDWFDSTGLAWVNPSPNLRGLTQAALYPGVAMVEHTNVSVGRGTDTPFEKLGAPWVDGRALAAYLNRRSIPGVRLVPVEFTPAWGPFAGERCRGVNILLVDRDALDAPLLGVELAAALRALHPGEFRMEPMQTLLANRAVYEAIAAGRDPRVIAEGWEESLREFRERRRQYLLYP
jgi:uncharacterized protein YbbC (DUF1343 family)/CubicO group peptidase (beta-lactamase class C family)